VAEELIFGHDKVTSGASSDIQMATNLAKAMVTQWGMSDKLGPLQYTENQEEVFLGHSVSRQQNVSEKTAELIDSEVKRLVIGGYDRAKQILTDQAHELEAVAQALLEYETLTGEEIRKVIAGEPIERPDAADKLPPLGVGGVSGLPKAGKRRGGGLGDVAPQA
jgi:cell division protease FtsH